MTQVLVQLPSDTSPAVPRVRAWRKPTRKRAVCRDDSSARDRQTAEGELMSEREARRLATLRAHIAGRRRCRAGQSSPCASLVAPSSTCQFRPGSLGMSSSRLSLDSPRFVWSSN